MWVPKRFLASSLVQDKAYNKVPMGAEWIWRKYWATDHFSCKLVELVTMQLKSGYKNFFL